MGDFIGLVWKSVGLPTFVDANTRHAGVRPAKGVQKRSDPRGSGNYQNGAQSPVVAPASVDPVARAAGAKAIPPKSMPRRSAPSPAGGADAAWGPAAVELPAASAAASVAVAAVPPAPRPRRRRPVPPAGGASEAPGGGASKPAPPIVAIGAAVAVSFLRAFAFGTLMRIVSPLFRLKSSTGASGALIAAVAARSRSSSLK
mmetsp:Transcript_21682/g.76137  ORF Transcript_21682/g.76137 Transcript_21682/m.76137 type:complete len:201 (-) Transcript_21682:473-1075(-)